MLLPDGTILTHTDANGMTHAYDPVKAHEYYLRVRKLKGRKKGSEGFTPTKTSTKPAADLATKQKAWENFLKSLPLAQEGMALPEVDKFVKSLRGKSNDELQALITKLKVTDAKSAHPSPKGGLPAMTVEKILAQRSKTQKPAQPKTKKLSAKEKAIQLTNVKKQISTLQAGIRDLESQLRKEQAQTRQTAAKAKRGPTRAEKAKSARDAAKYRDKNQQKLKSKANSGATKKESAKKQDTVATLQKKITEAKGALAIAQTRQRELSKA
ncbi:MAG TPA: hypothetical protein PKD12_08220 [Nitrospira sp.]|nr:hypothetical protein [Nitrospira sp.]